MKHLLRTLLVLAPVALSAQSPLVGSGHDLTTKFNGTTQVCVFCHTPHNAVGSASGPLWNHTGSPAATSYTVYASATMSQTMPGTPATMGSQTLACLGCHDGTVSTGAVANVNGTATFTGVGLNPALTVKAGATNVSATGVLTGVNLVGTDLSNDHPVSINYVTTGTGYKALPVSGIFANGVKVFSSKVECASCHDVHVPGTAAAGTAPFLRTSNAASALCTTCHNK